MTNLLRGGQRIVAAGLFVLALLCAPACVRAGVSVALTPQFQIITPGSDFTVFVDVTTAGSGFNGFELVLAYDPRVLTLLPTTPTTAQQGCLMTGGCSTACGTTFHRFAVTADSITVTDVLLCNQISLTGPGRLYQLRFHSVLTPQTTQIYLRHGAFFNDGVSVATIGQSKTSIGIGIGLGVGTPGTAVPRALRVEPNPSFGGVRFVSEDMIEGPAEADVMDLLGRVVRRLGPAPLGANASITWDGRDAQGARVPAGLYLVRIRHAGRVQNTRVMLLQ